MCALVMVHLSTLEMLHRKYLSYQRYCFKDSWNKLKKQCFLCDSIKRSFLPSSFFYPFLIFICLASLCFLILPNDLVVIHNILPARTSNAWQWRRDSNYILVIFRSSFPLLHSISMHFPSLASPVLFMSIMNERLKEKGRIKREEDGDPTLLIYYKVTFLW